MVVVEDVGKDERTRKLYGRYLGSPGITSLLNAPIRVAGQLVGAISIESTGPARVWHSDQQHFSMAIANMVSWPCCKNRICRDMARNAWIPPIVPPRCC